MYVLSLGAAAELDSLNAKKARTWGELGWVWDKRLFKVMMSGVSQTVDHQVRWIFDAVGRSEQYVRLDPTGSPGPDSLSVELDDVSDRSLEWMRRCANDYVEANDGELEAVADALHRGGG